jgi:hypothetical protein
MIHPGSSWQLHSYFSLHLFVHLTHSFIQLPSVHNDFDKGGQVLCILKLWCAMVTVRMGTLGFASCLEHPSFSLQKLFSHSEWSTKNNHPWQHSGTQPIGFPPCFCFFPSLHVFKDVPILVGKKSDGKRSIWTQFWIRAPPFLVMSSLI